MGCWLLFVTVAVASMGCGADLNNPPPAASRNQGDFSATSGSDAIVPPSSEDRSIRRELTLAIDRDSTLKERDISFIVSHGDVSVSGIVRSEAERQRINSLALGIPGVKSVANSLRVSE